MLLTKNILLGANADTSVLVLTRNSWKIFLRPRLQNNADPTSQQHPKQPWSSTARENFLETRLVNYYSHYYTFCYAVYETATV